MYNNIYESRKSKTTGNLERREYVRDAISPTVAVCPALFQMCHAVYSPQVHKC